MCPESLAHYARGTAKVGDKVVVKDFQLKGHGNARFTMYALESDPSCPVCVPNNVTICFSEISTTARKRSEVTEGPVVATLANGAFYESTFVFANKETVTLAQIRGAAFEVIPAVATAEDIDAEVARIFQEVGGTLEHELAVAAATTRMAILGMRAQVGESVAI